ncbi:MAG: DUF2946 domain-containing protein [Pontiella sp.]|nr:DUF2946 domain-containing protein [Pontiella sp.]
MRTRIVLFTRVNRVRTILSITYLLLMVLLPWLHMPLHGSEPADEIGSAHDTCAHHHDHQDEEPHEEGDCGLCGLAVLPAELPAALNIPAALYIFSDILEVRCGYVDISSERNHQARAPPFMTV